MDVKELIAFSEYVRARDKDVQNEVSLTEFEWSKYSLTLDFFKENTDLIPKFVSFVFKKDTSNNKKLAIRMTEYFHDETLDLTTIEESRPYFKKW